MYSRPIKDDKDDTDYTLRVTQAHASGERSYLDLELVLLVALQHSYYSLYGLLIASIWVTVQVLVSLSPFLVPAEGENESH